GTGPTVKAFLEDLTLDHHSHLSAPSPNLSRLTKNSGLMVAWPEQLVAVFRKPKTTARCEDQSGTHHAVAVPQFYRRLEAKGYLRSNWRVTTQTDQKASDATELPTP